MKENAWLLECGVSVGSGGWSEGCGVGVLPAEGARSSRKTERREVGAFLN